MLETEIIQDIVRDVNHILRRSIRSPLPLDLRFHPEMEQPNHHEIPLQAIKNCADDFNKRNIIGRGGYGSICKGILTWGYHVNKPVAVKRLHVTRGEGNKGFQQGRMQDFIVGVACED
ncbi:hypothetical protein Lser_V15G03316 [Lactuca serriola]